MDSTIHECNEHKGKRKEEIKWINSIHQGTGNKIQPGRPLGVREGLAHIPASPQRGMKASRIFHLWSVSLVLEGVGDAFHLHLFSLPPTSSVCVGVVMAAE